MAKAEKKPVHSALGLEIINGFKEILEVIRSGEPLESRFIVHDVEPESHPREYAAEDVRRVREDILKVSPMAFAKLLGVSTRTVQSWEQGKRPANAIARRFMDEITATPKHWRERVKHLDGSRVKSTNARP